MEGNVLIIGLGLIGGSVALAIKKEHPNSKIGGYDLNSETTKMALLLQVIDEEITNVQAFAEEADLIILATPVQQSEQWIEKLASWKLKNEAIVTDVGSTKGKIMNTANQLIKQGVTFIGGHPMAGSHKSGVQASKVHLFENAFYLLTPDRNVSQLKVDQLKKWLKGTHAHFIVVSPREHDELTGIVSHFPHIIAASIVHQAFGESQVNHDLLKRLAAGGFRDITRIASSNPHMWRDILLHNKDVLLDLMSQWQDEMRVITDLMQAEDAEGIFDYFQQAKNFRDDLPAKSKGAIPSFYDLYVDIPDYPGIISEVTGYLAQEKISITNIRILETREDLYGVLVLSFQTIEDRERAQECIGNYTDYETVISN
ncbi:prephenate dehydrogenase [Bacillus carboniphilus]|uniref:Prephenate dehydrogenase n=1 Tax=Bacillus carboniphilus TaxID=86663 RepID=A0ABN0WV95_9BACI